MKTILWLFKHNRKSALAVTMINIPLCISLAIASGASPLMWLLTWVWGWVIAAIFCSSKHNIYWPAGSLAWILLPVALTYGVQYIPILAIMWWLLIILFALLRLSKYITLIPGAALQWFLLWIGLIIWLQQLPAAFWLDLSYGVVESIMNIAQINWIAFAIFAWAMVVLKLCKRFLPQIPGAVVVTVLWVFIGRYVANVWWFSVDLLTDVYSDVTFTFAQFFDYKALGALFANTELLKTLIIAAVWVAVIAILETLISAKIATKETRVAYDSQKEIYGLWITNIATGLVWWLPVSALVVRTWMNITNGATSKLSWWLVWVFSALIALFLFSNALQFLPFAIIAAILVDVALGMINLSLYHKLWKREKLSIIIIVLVWVISYLRDPMMWILVWAVIALLTVVKRTMAADLVANVFRNWHHINKLPLSHYANIQHTDDIVLIKLEWELNYLSIESHTTAMIGITDPSTIILWFGHTSTLDSDALEEIELIISDRIGAWKDVYITWLEAQTLRMMKEWTIYKQLKKKGNLYDSKSALLDELLVR